MTPITLAISTDERGFAINATLIGSILRRTGRAVWVRCWCRGFLAESFETGRLKVEFLPAAAEVSGKFPGYVGPAVFDRLRVIDECQDWDRCLIMDYDQVALCDIAPLFDLELGEALLAAKMQGPGVDMAYAMKRWIKRPLPAGWEQVAEYPYFSMGPLLNLKAMREAGTWEKLLAAHAAFGVDEQLSLTAATEGRSIGFDRKWNLFPKSDIQDGEVPEGVVHWLGWPKPWHKDAKVWRSDIWEAERSSWEHLRMGIWDKPVAVEVEPDDGAAIRGLLERGWKVTVVTDGSCSGGLRPSVNGREETQTGACDEQRSRACGEEDSDGHRPPLQFDGGSDGHLFTHGFAGTSRPPLELAELGLVAFPDLMIDKGGAAALRDLLNRHGGVVDMVRLGPWAEPGEWLAGLETPPTHLGLRGGMGGEELAEVCELGYAGGMRLRTRDWPVGGPLPRVLEYGQAEPSQGVRAGEEIYLKREPHLSGVGSPRAFSGRTRERARVADPKKVGVLVTACGRQVAGLRLWLRSIRRNFLPGHGVTVFLFTDRAVEEAEDLRVLRVAAEPLTGVKLERYRMFVQHRAEFAGQDYLFHLDADTRVVGIVGGDILQPLAGVVHPGYHDKPRREFTYEERPESTAYVSGGGGDALFSCAGPGRQQGGIPQGRGNHGGADRGGCQTGSGGPLAGRSALEPVFDRSSAGPGAFAGILLLPGRV